MKRRTRLGALLLFALLSIEKLPYVRDFAVFESFNMNHVNLDVIAAKLSLSDKPGAHFVTGAKLLDYSVV